MTNEEQDQARIIVMLHLEVRDFRTFMAEHCEFAGDEELDSYSYHIDGWKKKYPVEYAKFKKVQKMRQI